MRTNYTPWTMQEQDILQKFYPYMTAAALQDMLPNRNRQSIYRKANQLGIRAYRRTADFIEYLRTNLGLLTYEQMATDLGVSRQLIAYRVRRLRQTF